MYLGVWHWLKLGEFFGWAGRGQAGQLTVRALIQTLVPDPIYFCKC